MRARAARRGRGDAAPVSPPTTRRDGEEFLAVAAKIPIHVTTTPFALHDADRALRALARDEVKGAAVLRVTP